ncbi:(Fe-S)-binding protein [Zafaria cholistanensis]|uniref:Cytochrome bc1 complex Rieske iron-sulfur subunit n=1 Tax=Zafaria cholistanensis TaxID=1682741 RepID=A0A5A7NRN7_9MICC|nr:Rieske (2Fe-2S) protein [Zafaria cholistanensis]GER23513.1 (Fe-S)-binding protein [Zafaria cholistanensis]
MDNLPSPAPRCGLSSPVTRRAVLGGVASAGAVAGLSACADPSTVAASSTPVSPAPGGEGTVAATTAELPVGSSKSVKIGKRTYLLFRPAETTVLAYRAVCTHAGCEVSVGEGEFVCHCHGSHFTRESGEVTAGPARGPLEKFPAEISGEDVLVYL